MKKLLCLSLAALMLAAALTGCGEKSTVTETESTVTETEATVTETEPSVTETELSVTVTKPTETGTEPTATVTEAITTAPPPPEEEWRSDAKKYNVYIRNYYEYKWLEDGNTP